MPEKAMWIMYILKYGQTMRPIEKVFHTHLSAETRG